MEIQELKEHENTLSFDPSIDKVLGVIGNDVHVEVQKAVLIIPREEYLRVWNNWLDGKKDYCERWKEYCGVDGYTTPKEIKEEGYITLNEVYVDNTLTETDGIGIHKVKYPVYRVTKFDDHHDFEHG